MDAVSIIPLVASTWSLLLPYVTKVVNKVAEKSADTLPDLVVGKVWALVKQKMEAKPETASLPADLAKEPANTDLQGAFKYQLQKLFEKDKAFAQQLQSLVDEAKKQNASYEATLHGDGSVAQGAGAVAVGRGGVHIGGNASNSTIITGNDNSVNTEKRKKR